jgi:predicted nucleic acid-binding protein
VKAYVIDASVAAKWVLPAEGEPLAEEAARVLDELTSSRAIGSVPELFWIEIAHVLWKSAQRGRIRPAHAAEAMATLRAVALATIPVAAFIDDALALAIAFRHPAYDCLYVAMARALDAELLTADEGLVRAFGTRFPLRWLGAV